MMKNFLRFLLVIAVAASLGGGWWLIEQDKVEKQQASVENEVDRYEKLVNQLYSQLSQANQLDNLQLIEQSIKQLKKEDERELRPQLDLAFAEYYFQEAEDNIFRARSIIEATGESAEKDGVNVIADQYINRAFDYYRQAKEKIDALPEIVGNDGYNFHLYYTKGNIYFRYLLLMAQREEALEIFNQTAQSWGTALRFKEKDLDTEMNLEMLNIKKQQALQNASHGQRQRVKLLPQQPNKSRGGNHGVI
ncbi:MAG: hypothetical protein ABH822_00735 [Patescibacteria group bacterium]